MVCKCKQCEVEHELNDSNDYPEGVISKSSNWCVNCSHISKGLYKETFVYAKNHKKEKKEELLIDPNQIDIFHLGA
jgi:hypothetical protein